MIHSANPSLLMGEFNPFTFKVNADRLKLTPVALLVAVYFMFYLLLSAFFVIYLCILGSFWILFSFSFYAVED